MNFGESEKKNYNAVQCR